MTTPTSSIASVPVTIPSPPPSAMQGGVAPFIWFNTPPLIVGVFISGQLDMMLVMVLVGIIWEQSLTRTVVDGEGSHDGGGEGSHDGGGEGSHDSGGLLGGRVVVVLGQVQLSMS